MTLDNGATHGQADPHATTLGCVERFEQPVRSVRVEAYPRISDGQDRRRFLGTAPRVGSSILPLATRR